MESGIHAAPFPFFGEFVPMTHWLGGSCFYGSITSLGRLTSTGSLPLHQHCVLQCHGIAVELPSMYHERMQGRRLHESSRKSVMAVRLENKRRMKGREHGELEAC